MRKVVAVLVLGVWAAGCSDGPGGSGAAGQGPGTAAVASGDVLTLDELVLATVVFEDLTPGVQFPDDEPPPGAPTLSAALFTYRATPGGGAALELEAVIERPEGWQARPSALARPNATWRLETPAGVPLQEGTFELPSLCRCGAAEDHVGGCVRTSHAATLRLDLPRLAPDAQLAVVDDAGVVLGTFDLSLTR